ncbi:hypothetical protein BKA80DRAFT_264310 [Phyllosticta citrichinensis]
MHFNGVFAVLLTFSGGPVVGPFKPEVQVPADLATARSAAAAAAADLVPATGQARQRLGPLEVGRLAVRVARHSERTRVCLQVDVCWT